MNYGLIAVLTKNAELWLCKPHSGCTGHHIISATYYHCNLRPKALPMTQIDNDVKLSVALIGHVIKYRSFNLRKASKIQMALKAVYHRRLKSYNVVSYT